MSGLIADIRLRDFGQIFSNEIFLQFDQYLIHSVEPEYKFVGCKLEKTRKRLGKTLAKFAGDLAMNSSPLDHPNISRIFPNSFEDRERYKALREELNKMNEEVCRHYDKLIEIAKKEL